MAPSAIQVSQSAHQSAKLATPNGHIEKAKAKVSNPPFNGHVNGNSSAPPTIFHGEAVSLVTPTSSPYLSPSPHDSPIFQHGNYSAMGNYTFQPTLASWSSPPPLRLQTPPTLGESWKDKYENYKLNTDEVIIQFRIRTARLEGELEHAKREVEEGRKSLMHVVTALTSQRLPPSASAQSSGNETASHQKAIIKDLEEEVYGLRKENRALRERIRRLEHDAAVAENPVRRVKVESDDATLKMGGDLARDMFLKRWQKSAPGVINKGKAKESYEAPKRVFSSFGSDPVSNSFPEHQETGIYDQSFSSSSSTLPKFPILPANHSTSITNVGFRSLNDLLGPEFEDDEKPLKLVPRPMGVVKQEEEEEEEEKSIEEQMRDQELAMQKFQNVPKPGVVKTGVAKGGRLGKEFKAEDPTLKETQQQELLRLGFSPKIWDSFVEVDMAIKEWRRETCGRDPHFPASFRYCVQYAPTPEDNNYHRSVLISNLPADISLQEVLTRVRGGMVLDSTLVNAPNGKTALITFVSSGAADDYIVYTGIHDIYFSSSDGQSKKSQIALIETPSYPISAALTKKLNSHNSTRCLRLPCFPNNLPLQILEDDIAQKSAFRTGQLTEMYFTPDKTLHLAFSSVAAAGSAFAILTTRKTYAYLEVHYENDPCSGPVEELALEAQSPKPLFPPGGFEDGTPATREAYKEVNPASELVKEVEGMQRKRLAVMENQRVKEIADMSGRNLISRPWAESDSEDEDEEELTVKPTPFIVKQNSGDVKQNAEEIVAAAKVHGVNLMMGGKNEGWIEKEGLRKPPVGLEGSKYAILVPGFRDRGREGAPAGKVEHELMRAMIASCVEPKEGHAREQAVLEEVENPDEIGLEDEAEDEESEPLVPAAGLETTALTEAIAA